MRARKVTIGLLALLVLVVSQISATPVVAALSASTLSSPSNGATGVSTTPTFSWPTVLWATSYQLQVSTSSAFSTTVIDSEVPLATSYITLTPLSSSTTYYWRVRAKSLTETSSWSSTWSFTTSAPALSPPTLSSPSNGATGVSTTPTLSWSSVSGALSYQLQVSTSSGFTTTVLDKDALILTSYPVTVLEALSSSTTYYWRVRAKSLTETSSWSSTWSFATAAAEVLTISNIQVTNVTSSSATITWTTSKSSGGTVYYGISKTLAITPAASLSTGTSHSVTLPVLLPETPYYFKVKAWIGLTEITATESTTDDNNGSYYTFKTGSLGIGTVIKEGAAFKLPQTIEDKITSFTQSTQSIPQWVRDLLPIQVPTTGFLLATEDSVSLVLSTSSDKGWARVEGWALTSPINLDGVSLSVILAENVSFTKDGQSVSLQQILTNPSQYNLQLVKVSAMRRQVSILFDLGQIKVPLTVGYLTDNPQPFAQLVRGAIDRGKDFIQNPDPSFVKSLLSLEEARVGVFDFETDYWTDAQAETNGIVLSSGHVIQTLKSIFPNASNLMQLDTNIPVIYDVKTELSYTSVSSVEEITSNLAQYRDKVVGLTVNAFGGRLSIQEAIKKAGVAIPVDVCVEGSVNWNNLSIPPEMNQILLAIGASNDSQDKIANQFNGRYFVVGRIVTTKQIDESWPEYPLLLIYDKERVGDINWAGLADPIKTFVENQVGKLYWTLSGFSTEPISGITVVPPEGISVLESSLQIPEIVFVPEKIELLLRTVAPETPLELRLENTEISKIMVRFRQAVENTSISFKKIAKAEVSVPSPPENLFPEVHSYFEVRLKATADTIDKAEVSFFILKEWLATRGANKDDVRLLRYHEGAWERLVTNFVNENQTHFMYTGKTPGFSVFSVAIYKPTATPPTEEGVPAEGINLALVGALVAILIGCGVVGTVLAKKRAQRSLKSHEYAPA